VLGGDYGIVEKDGSLTGGMTCPIVNTYYTLKYVEGPQKVGSCGANGDSAIVDVLVEDSLQSYLASDEHYVVPVIIFFREPIIWLQKKIRLNWKGMNSGMLLITSVLKQNFQ
jgi:hypothetical protein